MDAAPPAHPAAPRLARIDFHTSLPASASDIALVLPALENLYLWLATAAGNQFRNSGARAYARLHLLAIRTAARSAQHRAEVEVLTSEKRNQRVHGWPERIMSPLPDEISPASTASILRANQHLRDALGHFLDPLRVESIRDTGSFEMSLEGAGDLVRELGDRFDPATRKARREEARHAATMNELTELFAQREQLTAHTNKMLDLYERLVSMNVITPDEMRQAVRSMLVGQEASLAVLDSLDVKPTAPAAPTAQLPAAP